MGAIGNPEIDSSLGLVAYAGNASLQIAPQPFVGGDQEVVSFIEWSEDHIRIISARPATRREIKDYEENLPSK